MTGILKISEATALAFHAGIILGKRNGERISVVEMAELLGASKAHLAKVMQRMVKSELVVSGRGPSGGFQLAKPLDDISLFDIYESIEGRFPDRNCLFSKEACDDVGQCPLKSFLCKINQEVKEYFTQTTLKTICG